MNHKNIPLCLEQFRTGVKSTKYKSVGWLVLITLLVLSCGDEQGKNPEEFSGKIILDFYHEIENQPLSFDTLAYINAAGNPYLINEIQYFISDVRLYSNKGNVKIIDDWKAIHYVDTDMPTTQSWEVYDLIDVGSYDSVAFTFGISPERNVSFMYVNPPEKDMFWPEYLGGGYHYMKLNGKWLPGNQQTQTTPFDFHLGIGQVYHSYPDSITGFIHNNFSVSLPGSAFTLVPGEVKSLKITMQVDKWFVDPHTYDHDEFGGYIMQNQDAMQKVSENGSNVFTFEDSEKHED